MDVFLIISKCRVVLLMLLLKHDCKGSVILYFSQIVTYSSNENKWFQLQDKSLLYYKTLQWRNNNFKAKFDATTKAVNFE